MKKYRWLAVVCLFMVGLGFANLEAKDIWLTDYKAAQKIAEEKKLPMLLFFTGSDWCGWCVKLKKEVLDTSKFKKWAEKNVVAVELDFPRDKSKHTEENIALCKKYNVSGYPTIYLTDAKGEVIYKTGYIKGGETNYIKNLETILKKKSSTKPTL